MTKLIGKRRFEDVTSGDIFGYAVYPFDDSHIIVYKNNESKVVKIEPDCKAGYVYRILKKSIKCKNGLADFIKFVDDDLNKFKIGDYLSCTFCDYVAKEAFEKF